jgi:hypothetical protein
LPRELSIGWWNDVARYVLGFQEFKPLDLAEEIRAVAALEVDRPEWGTLKREYRFCTSNLSQGGVGGEFGYIVLINPLATGVLAIVELVALTTSFQAAILKLGALDPVLDAEFAAPATVTAGLDSREHAGVTMPNSALRTSVGTIAGAINRTPHYFLGLGAANQPAFSSYTDPSYRAILAPGSFLALEGAVAATALSGFFRYRERPLHKGNKA